jgi:hypothetical protein
MQHTFAIPVYRTAPNLAALVGSLRAQRGTPSEIILTSSTPSAELREFAARARLPLSINSRRLGIAADWNFALSAARTPLVTLAHQDDLFAPHYVERLRQALERHAGAVIAFSDYTEHTAAGPRPRNMNLRIKWLLRWRAFRGRECLTEPRDKLRLLSLGNPICCPSVMLARPALGEFCFPEGLQTNLDWMAWLQLARRPGGFVYVTEPLVSKGVHAGSETTATIASRAREREDALMFHEMWSRPVAAAIMGIYRLGYRANRVA